MYKPVAGALLGILTATTVHAEIVNIQVRTAFNQCKQLVITNVSPRGIDVTLTYRYEGQNGAHNTGNVEVRNLVPQGSVTTNALAQLLVNCSQPYDFRFFNVRTYDSSVQLQTDAAERNRRAGQEAAAAAEAQRRANAQVYSTPQASPAPPPSHGLRPGTAPPSPFIARHQEPARQINPQEAACRQRGDRYVWSGYSCDVKPGPKDFSKCGPSMRC